ncbi:MAG: hypothetical protein IJI30_04795, partial [Lachnospiraceae bacterium]|nr:hypothetical protein [Lachnospiraceae bacterium]
DPGSSSESERQQSAGFNVKVSCYIVICHESWRFFMSNPAIQRVFYSKNNKTGSEKPVFIDIS